MTETAYRPAVDFGGKIYFGTVDESKDLGTSKNDLALQLGLSKIIHTWTWAGTFGYLVTGDPQGVSYKKVFFGGPNVEQRFENNSTGMSLDAQGAIIPSNDGTAMLIGYLASPPDMQLVVTGYLLGGLSSASPDWGGGATLLFRY